MICRRSSLLAALALAMLPFSAVAADQPTAAATVAAATPAPAPNAAEAAFLTKIMRDLPRRYPNPKAANAAGYVRFTNEDETGAISYANPAHFATTDPDVPAQLWYDVKGRLIGADFSVLQASVPSGGAPTLFGLDAKRFVKIRAHVHYVTCDKTTEKCTYGKAVGGQQYAAAGDLQHPTAAGLVKAGAVSDAATVRTVFLFPAIYDAIVWVVPNPLGQFAEKNPNVIPSAHAGKGEDDAM